MKDERLGTVGMRMMRELLISLGIDLSRKKEDDILLHYRPIGFVDSHKEVVWPRGFEILHLEQGCPDFIDRGNGADSLIVFFRYGYVNEIFEMIRERNFFF